MLLVKDDIYLKKINRVMVALDKSEAASQSLKLALFRLRDLKGGELILTHIVQDLSGKSYCASGEASEQAPFCHRCGRSKTDGYCLPLPIVVWASPLQNSAA